MTTENNLKILMMRAQGYTLERIAKELGYSRQYVHQELNALCFPEKRQRFGTFQFGSIAKWMKSNQTNTRELAELLGMKYTTLCRRMNGTGDFTLSEIKSLIKVTSMSFDEMFMED